ncbi:hypothetical protein VNI00_006495 [Paramarasmius palmivorus]|uniref:Cytochrome P450 n=1 Tax=Paramarasmius palmivorus TaxID=297713 RepID=A0AAW0D999_9AGAR
MVFDSATTVFSISLLSGIVWLLLKQRVERGKLPPGPPRHWLYGSEFPTSFTWLRFEEWTQQYGPIFSLRRGGTNFIVIGRYEVEYCARSCSPDVERADIVQAAMEIMEKEGASLADRPRSIAVQETLCRNMRLLMMRAGERFKKTRRAIQSQLHPRTIQAYQPLQVRNAINLIRDLVRDPDQHIGHAKRYAASLIITLTYGKPTPSTFEEPMVQQIMIFMSRFVKVARLGAYWVDSIPLLRYVPGYLTQLDTWHEEELSFYSTYVDEVKQKINTDQDILKPNFVDNLIKNQKEYNMSEQEIAFLSGGLFLAGADTTAAAISIAMMAAACFPEEQVKVQSQIDAVVGLNRGFPHRATKDIIWRGYHIPKGSTVLGSHWSIGRSPDVFPDPEKFSVDRWIDESGKLRENIKSLNFGFGRRSLFITTAYILWAFRLREAPDAPIDTQGFTQTANIHPLPFKVLFEPRVEANHLQEILKEEEMSL